MQIKDNLYVNDNNSNININPTDQHCQNDFEVQSTSYNLFDEMLYQNYFSAMFENFVDLMPDCNSLYCFPYLNNVNIYRQYPGLLPFIILKHPIGEIKYVCGLQGCNKGYKTKNGILYHRKSGCTLNFKEKKYVCKYKGCDYKYRGYSGLRYHLINFHNKPSGKKINNID